VFVGGTARIRQGLRGKRIYEHQTMRKVPELVVEEMQKLVSEHCVSTALKRNMEVLDKVTTSKVPAVAPGTQ